MKKFIFIILSIFVVSGLLAQKQVRKEIRTGNDAYKEQRYETAQEHYQKAIEGNASSKEASFNLANTYYKQQRWDDALKEYEHYLTIETEKPENMSAAWNNMGNTFLKKKASERGQQQKMPQQGEGQQQKQPDNLQMSMEAYKNALRLNPADDEARYNLAVVQKMIQDQQQDGGGGGQDNKQDQKDEKKEDKQDQQQQQDQQKQDKQEQQQNQMSQQNIEQILQAIEQDERDTQDRVQKQKAEERKQKNQDNRRQNKDW